MENIIPNLFENTLLRLKLIQDILKKFQENYTYNIRNYGIAIFLKIFLRVIEPILVQIRMIPYLMLKAYLLTSNEFLSKLIFTLITITASNCKKIFKKMYLWPEKSARIKKKSHHQVLTINKYFTSQPPWIFFNCFHNLCKFIGDFFSTQFTFH